jgi:hypothetical protein
VEAGEVKSDSVRQRRQKLRDRYKLGFDRMAVVALCLFAAGFAAIALVVNDPYGLPQAGTPERQEIEAEVAAECVADQIDALATLCRERVMSGYRWAHYRGALGGDGSGWLYGLLLAAIGLGVLVPAGRWVIAGFRSPQPPVPDRSASDDRRMG